MKTELIKLAESVSRKKDKIVTEEATKQSLILPFLQVLGYDIFDPYEVVPEYFPDKAHGSDRVDYAIIRNGEPVILVECKHCKTKLNQTMAKQIHKYFFALPVAKLAILTNGIEYMFFTDIVHENIMDAEPFLSFNIEDYDSIPIDALKAFHKTFYNPEALAFMKEKNRLEDEIRKELDCPSEEFCKILFKRLYPKDAFWGAPKNDFIEKTRRLMKPLSHPCYSTDSKTIQSAAPPAGQSEMPIPIELLKELLPAGISLNRITATKNKTNHSFYLDHEQKNGSFRVIFQLFLNNPDNIRIVIGKERFSLSGINDIVAYRSLIAQKIDQLRQRDRLL